MDIVKNVEELMEKWTDKELEGAGVQHSGLSIDGQVALAQVLENADTRTCEGQLFESMSNNLGSLGGSLDGAANADAYKFRPISLSLVRRSFPSLIANKLCGVQAMATPVGLAYAMRAYYEGTTTEVGWENVPEYSGFSGSTRGTSGTKDEGTATNPTSAEGWSTLATDSSAYPRIQFKIDQKEIKALTRKIGATFSLESIADLRTMLNIDLEKQASDFLNYELIAEMDREIIQAAKTAALDTANGGAFDGVSVGYSVTVNCTSGLAADRLGDKLARVLYSILGQSEVIAKKTKRGAGNTVVASGRICTALMASGPMFTAINTSVNPLQYKTGGIDLVGYINGNIAVYRDIYADDDYALVAYKGADSQDAGVIWSPYNMGVQNAAVNPADFGKIIGVQSRYALTTTLYGAGRYYRTIKFLNADQLIPGAGL